MTILSRLLAAGAAPAVSPSPAPAHPKLAPEREAELREIGRKAVDDFLARTHVDRVGHFTPPSFKV